MNNKKKPTQNKNGPSEKQINVGATIVGLSSNVRRDERMRFEPTNIKPRNFGRGLLSDSMKLMSNANKGPIFLPEQNMRSI